MVTDVDKHEEQRQLISLDGKDKKKDVNTFPPKFVSGPVNFPVCIFPRTCNAAW